MKKEREKLVRVAIAIDTLSHALSRLSAAVAKEYGDACPHVEPAKEPSRPGPRVTIGRAGQMLRVVGGDERE